MEFTKQNAKIGFIGIGFMGKIMSGHLLKAGYNLSICDRVKEKAEQLIRQGAIWQDCVKEVASKSNLIITMLTDPKDVEEVYFGTGGIINNAAPGTYLLDMTTSNPLLAKRIYNGAHAKGMFALDAPVSGGQLGATKANLSIMVGGDQEVFEAVKPVLSVLGTNIILQGGAGAGQNTKMCNQILVASTMVGVSEAMAYAVKAGLDPHQVLKSIESGAAGSWFLSNYAPRMIDGNYVSSFNVKHFIKDIMIALNTAEDMQMEAPGLELAKSLYEMLIPRGEENSGTQALYKLYS
ncbi:MAG TPA: NAD(P)-dependent oxidoreductase [Desulfitobacteriaceae bacterium]|jgi:3-hydroxyisobutyrate dehydrogenase|nr:NAD(P)-dependent oxidoreductase [Desulfitobacteriaceae bacterium]